MQDDAHNASRKHNLKLWSVLKKRRRQAFKIKMRVARTQQSIPIYSIRSTERVMPHLMQPFLPMRGIQAWGAFGTMDCLSLRISG